MIKVLTLLVIIKGIIIGTLVIGVAEAGLVNGIIVAAVSALINGFVLYIVTRYGAKHVQDRLDEVKDDVREAGEKESNG